MEKEYIERQALKNAAFEASWCHIHDENVLYRLMDNIPNAEVVPKSEIEKYKLIHEHIINAILDGCDYSSAEAYEAAYNRELNRIANSTNIESNIVNEIMKELYAILEAHRNVYQCDSMVDKPYERHCASGIYQCLCVLAKKYHIDLDEFEKAFALDKNNKSWYNSKQITIPQRED